MLKRIIFFLILNFSTLAIGGIFTNDGVTSSWYKNLNKAPWTPPGWVFGAAWSTIMLCFAFYMTHLMLSNVGKKRVVFLFFIQFVLNIVWNPIFFYFQSGIIGMICITLLTLLIAFLFFNYWKVLKMKSLFLAPYLIWLIIAASLNFYILLYN